MGVVRRLFARDDEVAPAEDAVHPDEPGAELFALVAPLVPKGGKGRVAILSDDGASDLGDLFAEHRPKVMVVDLPVTMDPWERHARFVVHGRYDLVVDHTLKHNRRFTHMQDLLFLARGGGTMAIRNGNVSIAHKESPFADQMDLVMAGQRGEAERPARRGDHRAWDPIRLGRSIDAMRVEGDHLMFERRKSRALAKLNEPAMNLYLDLVGGDDRLVSLLPGEQFRSRCVLRYNAEERAPHQPEVYDTPDMSLRLYHDVSTGSGQVASSGRLMLPDTYRHHAKARMGNRYTVELAPRFAREKFSTSSLETLPGTYLYLDSEFRGHFGHLLTEQVSRLWAWPQVKAENPDAKVLMAAGTRPKMQEFEYVFLEAAGVAREDVTFITEPKRVERLYGATPMLSNPQYVHPGIGDLWRGVGDALTRDATDREWPERIFCSRQIVKRGCHNQDEVEALFREQGFEIVFPETFSMPDQVQMFRSAQVVAGFAGSGLFNLALVDSPKRVISVGSARYDAANEYMMASILGHEMDQVTCVPDDPTNFQSKYSFDHEREGRWLAGVFASLD